MRALILALSATLIAFTASAETLNDRVTAVEKKTGYFKIARVKKTWQRRSSNAVRNPRTGDFEIHLDGFTPVPSDNPVISNAWWTVDATYTSVNPFQFIFSAAPSCGTGGPLLPAGVGKPIHRKMFCEGAINVQDDGALHIGWRIDASAAGEASLDNIQIHVHTVNQVITEPPE